MQIVLVWCTMQFRAPTNYTLQSTFFGQNQSKSVPPDRTFSCLCFKFCTRNFTLTFDNAEVNIIEKKFLLL